jgi:uncharacterized membrane protein
MAPLSTDLTTQLGRLTDLERHVLHRVLGRTPTARDPNQHFDAQLTFGERLADRVAAFGGSWTFISLFGAVLVLWMAANVEWSRPFDKDRLDAHHDYEVNLRAEMEIMALHAKLDAVRGSEWAEFLSLQREQLQALQRIEARLSSPAGDQSNPDSKT